MWSLDRIAAGIVILAGTGMTVWEIARYSVQSRLLTAENQASEQTSIASRLERENRDLRVRISAQAAPLRPLPAIVPIPSVEPALKLQLREFQAREDAAKQALADERAGIAELQRDVSEKSSQLDTATRDRVETENRLREAERTLAQSLDRAAQQERELSGFRAQVRDLEGQIVQYQLTIGVQQQGLAQNLQIAAMLQSPSVRLVQLRATEAGPNARGAALMANNSTLAFYASNLPPLPNSRVYQLWLMRSRSPAIASGGIFATTGGSLPTIQIRSAELLAGLTGLAVTDEPQNGSPLPTGHKLLIGTPR